MDLQEKKLCTTPKHWTDFSQVHGWLCLIYENNKKTLDKSVFLL
jgi:hypothetical protein